MKHVNEMKIEKLCKECIYIFDNINNLHDANTATTTNNVFIKI